MQILNKWCHSEIKYNLSTRFDSTMASGGMVPAPAGEVNGNSMLVDKLPKEINDMKIRDDKVEKVDLC